MLETIVLGLPVEHRHRRVPHAAGTARLEHLRLARLGRAPLRAPSSCASGGQSAIGLASASARTSSSDVIHVSSPRRRLESHHRVVACDSNARAAERNMPTLGASRISRTADSAKTPASCGCSSARGSRQHGRRQTAARTSRSGAQIRSRIATSRITLPALSASTPCPRRRSALAHAACSAANLMHRARADAGRRRRLRLAVER